MFSFFKKASASTPNTDSDFGTLCTEKQQKLEDCTRKLDVILEKKEFASDYSTGCLCT